MTFSNKVALITGAGRGLGRAVALALAAEGAQIVGVARTKQELDETVSAIESRGGRAHRIVADLSQGTVADAVAARAAALAGHVDIVIHAAGTLGPTPLPTLASLSVAELEHVFAVNTVAPFRITQALLGAMVLRNDGLVVVVSSDAAVEAYPHWGAYSASKLAADHLFRVWAAELSQTELRLLSVDPGEMRTRMHADALPDADETTLADPADIAAQLSALLREPSSAPSGSRVVLANQEVSR